jgi:hypothetical protein
MYLLMRRKLEMKKLIVGAFLGAIFVICTPSIAATNANAPWSTLVAGSVPERIEDGYFIAVLISSLDGQTPTNKSVITSPGKKRVLVDTPNTKADRAPSHKRIEIDMAPCMRYFIAGKKSAAASLRWLPEVFRVEPIGECMAEFKVQPAEAAK